VREAGHEDDIELQSLRLVDGEDLDGIMAPGRRLGVIDGAGQELLQAGGDLVEGSSPSVMNST
jgi:hypothetical protein